MSGRADRLRARAHPAREATGYTGGCEGELPAHLRILWHVFAFACAALFTLALLALVVGCGGVIAETTRTANVATVVLYEGKPMITDGIARDAQQGASADALEETWRPRVRVYDRLVDTTLALRAAIRAAKAAEKAGKEPSPVTLLAAAAEVSTGVAAMVAAFPELAEVIDQ